METKALHGRYPAFLSNEEMDTRASNSSLEKSDLFAETEGFILGIQDQVISILKYRKFIQNHPTVLNEKCRLCHAKSETREHFMQSAQN